METTKNPLILTKYLQEIHEGKKDCAFYGGDVVEIELLDKANYKYDKVIIMANGDVIGDIYDRNCNCVCHFKDKSNNGDFFEKSYDYIKNDEELEAWSQYKMMLDEDALAEFFKLNKDMKYLVNFDNNNWWEAFCIKDNKVEYTFVLEATDIEEAIKEVLDPFTIPVLLKPPLDAIEPTVGDIASIYKEDNNIKHRVEFGKETYNSESIVIIDSAFIVKDEDDWDETNYGTDLSKLGFDKYVTFGTGFDIFNVLTEAEYDDMSESARHYGCTSNLINVPTGILGVFRYDDIMKYNPDFDLEELLDNYNCFIAGDFIGELKFYDVGNDGEVISIVGIGTYGEDRRSIKFKVEPMIIE